MVSVSAGVFPDAVALVAQLLEDGRLAIDTALKPLGTRLKGVYPYYSETIGFDDMPCVLLEEDTVETEWHAIPLIAMERYSIRAWGYIAHEEPSMRRQQMVTLARAVQAVLNRHVPPVMYEGVQYFWSNTLLPAVSFGIGFVGNSVVAAFTGTIVVQAEVSYAE